MIRFARYIFVGESHALEVDPHDELLAKLIAENLIDDSQNPKGKLKSYCDSMQLIEPKIEIGHLAWTTMVDPFIDLSRPRHRCPVCDKVQPSDGTFVEHPVTGAPFRIEIKNCISCGVEVDRTWEATEDEHVFRTRFMVSLIAQNFAAATPTIGEIVPSFIDIIAKTCGVPVKEIFIALRSD